MSAARVKNAGPRFILAGATAAEFETTINALSAQGIASLVVTDNTVPWSRDIASQQAGLGSVDALAAALTPGSGGSPRILIAGDDVWPLLAAACERLGDAVLEAQVTCRIKPLLRKKLRPELSTAWAIVDVEAADDVLDGVFSGLPSTVVLKPLWGTGSRYVTKVQGRLEAGAACRRLSAVMSLDPMLEPVVLGGCAWDPRRQLLVEAFVEGTEYSIEGYVAEGVTQVLMIQEKARWRSDVTLPFETLNLAPTPNLSVPSRKLLERATAEAVGDAGLDQTFFHIELREREGRVTIIEINPRLGGGSVPAMLDFWFGEDVGQLALKLAMGEAPPPFGPGREGFLVGVFVNAQESGVFSRIEGAEWCRAQAQFAFETFYRRRGEIIPPPESIGPDRSGWMYLYDAFFWCQHLEDVDPLYDGTLAAVRAIMR
jgi:hypothetical protein